MVILSACQAQYAKQTAITNVTVIDAVHGVRANQTVVFEGDKIVSVDTSRGATTAETRIDGRGKYLIPGLWDMHVHLTYDPDLTDAMPYLFLQHGVTSVRDTGGLLNKLQPVIARMRQAGAIAPRVYFSGPLMDGTDVVYDGVSVPEIGIANKTVVAAIENVRHLRESGVDFIKIYEMVTPEVFEAISEAAREHGMPIAAHVPLSMTASTAAPLVDSFEHLRNIELDCAGNADELLRVRLEALTNDDKLSGHALRGKLHRLQRIPATESLDVTRCDSVLASLRSVIQIPTASLNTLSLWPPWERDDWTQATSALPDDLQTKWRAAPGWVDPENDDPYVKFAEYVLTMISTMHSAGVPIGAGTDTPIARAIPGDSLHSELEVLVHAGLTPLEAIESATIRPAQFFGFESEMGAIQEGMAADLVLLNANPLLDIRSTRSIHTVIYRGNILGATEH